MKNFKSSSILAGSNVPSQDDIPTPIPPTEVESNPPIDTAPTGGFDIPTSFSPSSEPIKRPRTATDIGTGNGETALITQKTPEDLENTGYTLAHIRNNKAQAIQDARAAKREQRKKSLIRYDFGSNAWQVYTKGLSKNLSKMRW